MIKHFLSALLAFCLFTQPSLAQQTYPSTLTVAQDGSGNYKTIQEAVNSVRDLGQQRVRIYIKKGKYHEKLIIPSWKTNISLIGESPESTIITGNDYSGKPVAGGKDGFGLEKYSTYTSYSVLVQGNDVLLENLTIENTAGRVGQAVALHVEGDRVIVRNCHLLGNQDTLFTAKEESRQYYEDCLIAGTTDFIFGEATCVFQRCTIRSLADSYITASAQRQTQKFGYVFFDCKLVAAPEVKKVYLGRPWRPFAKTVFIRTEMGPHITPEGWHPWPGDKMFPDKEKTAYYAEYQSTGAGANTAQRVGWSRQLSKKEARKYTLSNILGGEDKWQIMQTKE
jgi:pectinesterase